MVTLIETMVTLNHYHYHHDNAINEIQTRQPLKLKEKHLLMLEQYAIYNEIADKAPPGLPGVGTEKNM